MSVAGDASSDDGGSGNANGEAQQIDEEHTLLMKESEHVPLLREHILQEKIKSALTAAGRGDKSRLEALFSSDEIDFNCKDEMQRTPLHIAASEGHVHVAEYLLLQKADPSAKDKFGTLSQHLEKNGHVQAAEASMLMKIDVEGAVFNAPT